MKLFNLISDSVVNELPVEIFKHISSDSKFNGQTVKTLSRSGE